MPAEFLAITWCCKWESMENGREKAFHEEEVGTEDTDEIQTKSLPKRQIAALNSKIINTDHHTGYRKGAW